jgi:hypothetical protein
MPSFPKPSFDFNYRTGTEKQRLRAYRDTKPGRQIPNKTNNTLLSTRHTANLGQQQRRTKDDQLIAEIISWFDIVAIQETKDDLSGLRGIQNHLPGWKALFSDKGGNDERMAWLYHPNNISVPEKVARPEAKGFGVEDQQSHRCSAEPVTIELRTAVPQKQPPC